MITSQYYSFFSTLFNSFQDHNELLIYLQKFLKKIPIQYNSTNRNDKNNSVLNLQKYPFH